MITILAKYPCIPLAIFTIKFSLDIGFAKVVNTNGQMDLEIHESLQNSDISMLKFNTASGPRIAVSQF